MTGDGATPSACQRRSGSIRLFNQACEGACGGAAVDGVGGKGESVDPGRCTSRHDERRGGVEHDDIAARPPLAPKNIARDRDRVFEVAGLQRFQGGDGNSHRTRVDDAAMSLAVAEFDDLRRGGRGDLVESIVAVDDHGSDGAEPRERHRHFFECAFVVHTKKLVASTRGIRQRTKQIEDRGDTHRLANTRNVPRSGVVLLGEAEANGGAIEATCLHLGRGIDLDAKRREQLRRTSPAAACVAVLGDTHSPLARSRSDESGDGGDVERLGRAARAAGIEDDAGRGAGDGRGMATHDASGPRELLHRRATSLDEREHCGDLGVRNLALEDKLKGRLGVALGERLSREEMLEAASEIHAGR